MPEESALKKLVFESYNAMSRPAMVASIPIMPFIALMMCGLLSGIAGTFLISWVCGLIFAAPFAGLLITLRLICMIDPQYPRRVLFAFRRLRLNLRYGKPLLLTSFNPDWSRFYGQRFAQQRYAGRGESTFAPLPGGREYGDATGQSPGEHDQAQGHLSRDSQ